MATKTKKSTPLSSESDSPGAKYLPYLQEIQKKLYTLLAVTLASGALGFIFYQKILSTILKLFNLKGITIVFTSPYQFIDLAINTGLVTGFITTFPLFLFYLLSFLKPALKPKEYQLVKKLIPVSLVLFIVGFAFGTWIMQFVVDVYSQTTTGFDISNLWDINHFFGQIIILGLCMGIVFQLPVVVTLLIRLKVIKHSDLASKRRYIYAGILIFAALLPPNDILSLTILATVPLFLFEFALLFNKQAIS
jgi:sec-independent protein translocase protein TatC